MENRTCILVTHHIRLCLPLASMLIKMVGGRAEVEEIGSKNVEDLPDGNEMTQSLLLPVRVRKRRQRVPQHL